MLIHPSKRAFLRRYPAPPPTPEGKVWHNNRLIDAAELQARCARAMAAHDAKWEAKQKRASL
jgi:hypothetical protein